MAITQVGAYQSGGTTINIPAGNLGDWIFFGGSWNDTTSDPTASDPTNGTYTAIPVIRDTTAVTSLKVFYKENVAAAAVSVTTNTIPLDLSCWGGRFRGVATSSSVTASPARDYTAGATNSYSLGSPISPSAGDLVIISWASEAADTGVITPDTGYSQLAHNNSHFDAQVGNLSASAGSQTPLFTGVASTTNWVLQVLVATQPGSGVSNHFLSCLGVGG